MSRAKGTSRKRRRGLIWPVLFIALGAFWLLVARANMQRRVVARSHAVRVERIQPRRVQATPQIAWTTNPATGHLYAAVPAGTRAQSESAAARLGGHLVTINDADEQAWLLDRFGPTKRYWIGLTDAGSEGQWRWVTGEPLDYTNWAPDEPNDYGSGSEDYAHMGAAAGGAWNDLGPHSAQWSSLTKAIVEREGPMPSLEVSPASAPLSASANEARALEPQRRVLQSAGPEPPATPVRVTR